MGRVGFRRHFNRQLALACLLIAMSTMNYGFDNSGFNTSMAMDSFQKQFGDLNPKTGKHRLPPVWLSLFNSLPFIGFGFGVLVGSLISARFGRRWCMFSMSTWALFSAAVCVSSSTREQIMAGRILNYVYIGMELSVIPVFQSEIIPAPVRGMAVGSYQFSLLFGGLIVNSVCRGTSTMSTNAAWRIPMGLFFVIPSTVMAGIWFVPESPRWLLANDRTEEAYAALKLLRAGTLNGSEIEAEFEVLKAGLRLDPEQGKFIELFQGINRKRTAIVVVMNFFQQATGQAFTSTYGALFVKDLGTVNAFNFTLILAACNLSMVAVGLFLNDRLGRRPLLFIGGTLQGGAILAMGALGTQITTYGTKTGIVALLVIFAASFVFAWAQICYVVTTEVPALRLRDMSQRTASIVNVATSFLVNFSVPYLLYTPYAALGSKVGFIFGGIIVCALIFTFFCVPECKGKSLEQVDRMFQEGIPLRHFGRHTAFLNAVA
ncbi:sugar transporter [Leptodontidium sp. 2 PMI_412]|nr:sugar transporter [Leptodontidium sp. 2 PMI_412]